MRLKGKRAIVTGSSAGIGKSIALMLAAEGASVVINARGADKMNAVVAEIRGAGGTAIGVAGPVDDERFCNELIDRCVGEFGGLDILINNAAVYSIEAIGQLSACSTAEWMRIMGVNLHAPFFLCRAALPHMIAQRWGRIINAASYAGTGKMGGSAYSVSKSALFGLTRALAADYGPYGITSNAFNPEAITAMGNTVDPEIAKAMRRRYVEKGWRAEHELDYLNSIGGPDAIAPFVTYLCLDEADYLNGHTFALESRRIALLETPDEERILYRDHARQGIWSLEELRTMAPLAFPLSNTWPRRTGEALARWEKA
jgi:3-oxoacyl-[acyl-carrier protein] reductase